MAIRFKRFKIVKNIFNNQRAQIFPFMVIIIVILLLAIPAIILIGEVSFERIRLANIADSAVISAASELARTLNQIRIIHTQMLLRSIQLQATLLFLSPFVTKVQGYQTAWISSMIGIDNNRSLYREAREILPEAIKSLRANLWDQLLGGALIDEPKPFIDTGNCFDSKGEPIFCPDNRDEIARDSQNRITGINYPRYLQRRSHFEEVYLNFKRGEGQFSGLSTAGRNNWFRNNHISYSFNKHRDRVLRQRGVLRMGAPDQNNFESFIEVILRDVPTNIDLDAQTFPYIFFFCQPCTHGCCFWPGFVINPWAWIRRVNMDSRSFGVEIRKRLDYTRLPFFGRQIIISHRNQVRIMGNLHTGFSFRMEE